MSSKRKFFIHLRTWKNIEKDILKVTRNLGKYVLAEKIIYVVLNFYISSVSKLVKWRYFRQ